MASKGIALLLLFVSAARTSSPSNSVVRKYLPPTSKKAERSIALAEEFAENKLVSFKSSCGVPLSPVETDKTSAVILVHSSCMSTSPDS